MMQVETFLKGIGIDEHTQHARDVVDRRTLNTRQYALVGQLLDKTWRINRNALANDETYWIEE